MAYNEQGAWSETCLIGVTAKDGSEVQFAALIETVDIDMGDKDVEVIANLKGGRVIKKVPQAETTITFEGYPIGIDASAGTGFSELFNDLAGATTIEPLTIDASLVRTLYRVAILWSTGTETTAGAATTASNSAYRFAAANCYMTSYKPSFTDGILKATISFKVAPFNRLGIAQIREESTEGTTALTVLGSYNTTNFPIDSATAYTW